MAVLVSSIGALFIIGTGKKPNLRESWSIIAGILKLIIILSMIPAVVYDKKIISYSLFNILPGIEIAFRVDAFGLLFAMGASILWIATSFYSIGREGYRGLHRLNKFPEGRIKCVACEMCSAACPADCIHIIPGPSPWDGGKERYPVRFDIDLLRCIFCGFCEMACPEEAIELTEIYDFSDYTRNDLVIDKEGLLEVYDLTKDQNYYTKKNLSKASSVDTAIDT